MALEAAAPHHSAAAKLFEAPDGFRGTYEEVARARGGGGGGLLFEEKRPRTATATAAAAANPTRAPPPPPPNAVHGYPVT